MYTLVAYIANNIDPDQTSPNGVVQQGSICLQRLSAGCKIHRKQENIIVCLFRESTCI